MCLIVCTAIIIMCALFAFGNCYKTDGVFFLVLFFIYKYNSLLTYSKIESVDCISVVF